MKKQNRFLQMWAGAADLALDLLCPPRCPLCDSILRMGERTGFVCGSCAGQLPWIREPRCMRCGRPLSREEAEYCFPCSRGARPFAAGECTFLYEKSMRDSVLRMKFQNRREYLPFYAHAMAERHRAFLEREKPELMIPVPMHPKKRAARGFDQCLLLARQLSELTGIPVEREALRRTRYTAPQKGLSREQRRRNISGAFLVSRPERIRKRILLVDDIYTTGATIDECSAALLEAGARRVCFLALCAGRQ